MIKSGAVYLSRLALLFAVVCAVIPFSPKMPSAGIDYSWAISLNQAVSQGLIFGKDIIFTLGPYACLYTKVYHPATDNMMIISGLYFSFIYWWVCLLLMRKKPLFITFIFILALLGMLYARDAVFFSYPLLLGLWIVNKPKNSSSTSSTNIVYGIFSSLLGLLMLIKGTFLLQTIVFIIILTTFLIASEKKITALTGLTSACISCCIFWLAANQPIPALPGYLLTTLKLSMGFSESMSREGNYNEIYAFLSVALIQIILVMSNKQYPRNERLIMISLLMIFLFISFKAGFTRHLGHAYVASTALLFSGIIFCFVYRRLTGALLLSASLLGSLYINDYHTQMSLSQNIRATVTTALYGIHNRLENWSWPKDNYQMLMHFIADQAKFPHLAKTSDIYSYDQVYLLASGHNWSPRPVFQSYSAFTAEFANINKDKLKRQPPDQLFFRIQPIDHKLPSLDDGPSWQVILNNYKLNNMRNGYLVLHKSHQQTTNRIKPLANASQYYQLNERVELPEHTSKLFAQLAIEPTLWGRLWSFLYNPDQLHIQLSLQDGSTRVFRLSANMAQAEFLLSPLIEETQEFAMLIDDQQSMSKKRVKSFKIISVPKNSNHWSRHYSILLTGIQS